MADTSKRTLRLLSLLQMNRFWPGAELAERLRVSERTLRRDVDRLRELGYQVVATPGVGGGYRLRAGRAMPPLLLTDEEAVAIAVGLRTAAAGAVAGFEEVSVGALAKLVDMMPPRLRRRLDVLRTYTAPGPSGGGPRVDAAVLVAIAQACRDTERLRFDYAAADGERTRRLVEPSRLVWLNLRWYLLAWDAERHDWRTFRVDRMTRPQPAGSYFRPREVPGGDPADFVRSRLAAAPARHTVVALVRASAEEVVPAVAEWGRVEAVDEGSCRLVMPTDDLEWPALVLLSVGAEFEVEQSPAFRDYLRSVGGLFVRGAGG